MAAITGIEVGPESSALVGVRPAGRATVVFALHVIETGARPAAAVTEMLAASRRSRKFPRRARAVIWGAPDGVQADDPAAVAILRPFTDAGFRIESICTPSEALACLAATRRRPEADTAVAWMSINTHGAAIAIVRSDALLYLHAFDWAYAPGRAGSTAQLLQRYSFVAHLAPELQRGIESVRASHDCPVETAVTCGDLPDLRSLTMPLIEELDIEVETLDSLEGLQVAGSARRDRFAENAPALRLAIATALGPRGAQDRSATWRALQTATVVAAAAGVVWLAYAAKREPPSPPADANATRAGVVATPPVREPAPVPQPPPPVVEATPETTASAPTAVAGATSPPVRSAQQTTRVPADTVPPQIAGRPADVDPTVRAEPPARGAEPRQAPPADRAERPFARRPPDRAVPLRTPLPRLDSILVDGGRRLAVIDGQIVGIGGKSGERTVIRIDPDGIVLQEPSGLEVRVPLGFPGSAGLPKH